MTGAELVGTTLLVSSSAEPDGLVRSSAGECARAVRVGEGADEKSALECAEGLGPTDDSRIAGGSGVVLPGEAALLAVMGSEPLAAWDWMEACGLDLSLVVTAGAATAGDTVAVDGTRDVSPGTNAEAMGETVEGAGEAGSDAPSAACCATYCVACSVTSPVNQEGAARGRSSPTGPGAGVAALSALEPLGATRFAPAGGTMALGLAAGEAVAEAWLAGADSEAMDAAGDEGSRATSEAGTLEGCGAVGLEPSGELTGDVYAMSSEGALTDFVVNSAG